MLTIMQDKMQTIATMRYSSTQTNMAKHFQNDNAKCWQAHREKLELTHCRWECKIGQ